MPRTTILSSCSPRNCLRLSLFFFFQAEDGIRDLIVTGVQTCALPILKTTRNSAKPLSAEAIARRADRGKDVSRFFKGEGRMVQPIQRVNVDVSASMLEIGRASCRERV